ncbi:hypothetical protein [Ornithinimicrobium sp. W1665]|uniref:hypothetical protein n=1 Tax=Ornithinimicrobium sp. W1665 TaxID=3416666 RepID=UPI003D6BDC11
MSDEHEAAGRTGAPSTKNSDDEDLGSLPHTRSISRWDRIWSPFWVLPTVIIVLATLGGIFMPELDQTLDEQLPYFFPGGPSGARSMHARQHRRRDDLGDRPGVLDHDGRHPAGQQPVQPPRDG